MRIHNIKLQILLDQTFSSKFSKSASALDISPGAIRNVSESASSVGDDASVSTEKGQKKMLQNVTLLRQLAEPVELAVKLLSTPILSR